MAYTTIYGSYMSTAGGSNFIRPYFSYEVVTGQTSTQQYTTVNWIAGCNIKSGASTNAKINIKVTITDRTTQTASVDDMGWSGGNHAMITSNNSWYRTTSSQSITFKVVMTTNVDSSSVSQSFTVPALSTFTLSYNTGGGSSVASQTFYYGVSGNVSSTKPTRTNYTFQGWANTSGGSVAYQPKSAITLTANKTLYAVWKSACTVPTIRGDVTAYRVSARGSTRNPTLVNDGTVVYIEFTTNKGVNVSNYLYSYSVKVDGSTSSLTKSLTLDSSGSSTNVYYGYIGDPGDFDKDTTYSIEVIVTIQDVNSQSYTFSAGTFISAEVYEIDISADGKRVAFGALASDAPSGTTRTDFAIEVAGDVELTGDLKIGNDTVVDYTVAQGTSGNWKYRKYKSGIFEAWYYLSGATVSTGSALSGASGWYRNTDSYPLSLPSIGITSVDHAHINAITGLAGMYTTVTALSTSQVDYYVIYSGQLSSRSAIITAYVKGTWA